MKLTIDLHKYLPDWEGYEGYSCPVLVIPSSWASALEFGIVNDENTVIRAKIDGMWFPIYGVNRGHIGEYRVPNGYPETRIEKVMTSKEMSLLLWGIAKSHR